MAIVVVAALMALTAWLLLGPEVEPATGPLVGAEAPEVADEVEQWVQGGEIDIADLGGRPVLLYFWHPRDGKPTSPAEAGASSPREGGSVATLDHVQGLAARFEPDGLVTIGLCVCDDPSEVQPLIDEHRLTFRIALDSDADIHIRKYRIDQTGTPYCYLIAPDRRIVWQGPPDKLTPRRIRKLLR